VSVKILFFSRNGNSSRIANKLAKRMHSEVAIIKDDINWKGPIGFLKGGFFASKWKTTNARIEPDIQLEEYDKIVIVSPVWANNVAPAVYSLILKEKKKINRLCLIINNSGSDTNKAFENIKTKLGTIDDTFSITKSKKNEDMVIEEILRAIS